MIRNFWPCLRLHFIFMKRKTTSFHRTEKSLILLKSIVVNVVFSFFVWRFTSSSPCLPEKKSNNAFSDDCEGPDFDVYRIVYVLYALQLCSFVQAVWPLDATVIYSLVRLFGSTEQRAEMKRLAKISLFYRERNRGSESILLTENKRPSERRNREF